MDGNSSFIRPKSVRMMVNRIGFALVSAYVAFLAIDLIRQLVLGNL